MLRRGWTHSVYEWKQVFNSWPEVAAGLVLDSAEGEATFIEYPLGSGHRVEIVKTQPEIEIYDECELFYGIAEGVLRSDLDLKTLNTASFAAYISRLLSLGNAKPIQMGNPFLFKLPLDGRKVFLSLHSDAAQIKADIIEVRNKHGQDSVFIALFPHLSISTVQAEAAQLHAFTLDELIQVNEVGDPTKCTLIETIGNRGRVQREGFLGLKLPPEVVWEDLYFEISTRDRDDIKNKNFLSDKLRIKWRTGISDFSSSAPRSVLELHPRFHDGKFVTALWLMLRDYARGEGKRPPRKRVEDRNTDNTNRSQLAKVLKDMIGLDEKPFRSTKNISEAKFHICFKSF